MGDFDPSKFFDLSDFDLKDSGGLVSNQQIDAEKKDARREPTTPAQPLPPGVEQARAWAASFGREEAHSARSGDDSTLPEPSFSLPEGTHFVTDEELEAEIAAHEAQKAAKKASARGAAAKDRPTITVTPGYLPQIVDAAEAALIKADAAVFQRGTTIVRPAMVPIKISGGRETTAQQLVPLGHYAIVEEFSRAAHWQKMGEKEPYPIDCPLSVARTYAARVGRWRLRTLTGLVNCPILREDGSLLAEPGYDQATGLLFDPQGIAFWSVAEKPAREDARQALAVLKDLLKGFPFVGDADRSVALSAILTAVVRRTLGPAPLHGFTAPVAGSGKSMLVDIASIIATGHEGAVIEEGDENELPKRLGAALLAGTQVIAIDNVERGALGGGFLCQVLTQPFLNIRVLGQSENRIIIPNAFLCATGNNLRLAGDMTRRALLCTLDPGCERPELREFDVDPIETVKANRPLYVFAALTVLRAYHVAGQPQKVSPTGSFASWSRLVRAALVWLGEADPWMTTEAVRGGDPKLEALIAVVEQWRSIIGAEPVSVRALIERATRTQQTGGYLGKEEFAHPDFREALLAIAGRGGAINGQALGNWLGRNRGRIIGGFKLERRGIVQGNATWQLVNA